MQLTKCNLETCWKKLAETMLQGGVGQFPPGQFPPDSAQDKGIG